MRTNSLYMEGINFLPPGFRFHPTDEELINYYLKNKLSSTTNPLVSIIAEINLYKFNPWDLPDKALFGESEWFFFSPRDRKYPNGARPNRSAASGYWKATGTDKPILSYTSQCIGVKKALVFYKGRAPNGAKTNWMMHEYRLLSGSNQCMMQKASMRLDDWVLCRVRQKSNTTCIDPNGENAKSKGAKRRYFNCEFEGYGYGEEDSGQNISYFRNNNNVWHHPQQTSQTLQLPNGNNNNNNNNNNNTNLDFQGAGTRSTTDPSDHCISTTSHESFDSSHVNMNHSVQDALNSIKRVLSLGAIDEQGGPKQPNSKRLRSSLAPSSTCFNSSSSIFDIPSS